MSEVSRTTLQPDAELSIAEKQAAFCDSRMEPEQAKLRQLLGLRPSYFSDEESDNHPDRRPCPTWCWVGQDDEYDHDVDWRHPLTATHTMGGTPHVVAELYSGSYTRAGGETVYESATIEPHLEQEGQEAPTIRVHLRHWLSHQEMSHEEVLRLSLSDADELSRTLDYLVRLAYSDGGREWGLNEGRPSLTV